jgi:hypothetical protein
MPIPNVRLKTPAKVPTKFLDFDPHNPRLIEDGIKEPNAAQIIQVLAEGSDLSELVASIAANGYIDIEPLIVQRTGRQFRVLEGNRRLAAIRILQSPALATGTGITVPTVSAEVKKSSGRSLSMRSPARIRRVSLSGSNISTGHTSGMR